ncbi:hypothetical protein SASPL_145806 [Salvia splendens]|uniref:G protein gamma domain-containing protein n=1 Tax=Salvia splendens TaxID=180675 RepID=A0A8X8WHP6_SALSN|nr:hypothetical protein SASPL_145806 [Salvia splendens]
MQTGNSGEVRSGVGAPDTRGKHRISAELKRLEQEIRFLEIPRIMHTAGYEVDFTYLMPYEMRSNMLTGTYRCEFCILKIPLFDLEEELEQLEKMENASSACKEMLINIETRPDPLLPETIGPINTIWDRWFEGPQESSGCRCWIL